MKIKIFALLFLATFSMNAQKGKKAAPTKKPVAANQAKPAQSNDGLFVEFETAKGKILVRLEYQKAPITVANFVALAEGKQSFVTDEKLKGKPFYDGLKFHRVIKDFMIQGGDPAGNGSGGPGYSFKDEIVKEFVFDKAGILAMANSGPATNGSQFFITHKDTPWLTGKHTIFGYVVTGQNVVDAIAQDDVMKKVTIIRKGAAAKAFDAVKVFNDYYANKAEDDKKQAAVEAEARAKKEAVDAEAKKAYDMKYAPIKAEKVKQLAEVRKTATKNPSGLEYAVIKKGTDKKPAEKSLIYIHYAGYLEDGSLFDSSYEDVNKTYGKYDENRAKQSGYMPFPFEAGRKDGLIPGFIEGLEKMNIGEKAVFFIPSNLGYGERGAGGVIPPNANIIFEVEVFDTKPDSAVNTTEKK